MLRGTFYYYLVILVLSPGQDIIYRVYRDIFLMGGGGQRGKDSSIVDEESLQVT